MCLVDREVSGMSVHPYRMREHVYMDAKPRERLLRVAAAINQRRNELETSGVSFRARAARRLTLHGIRYELQLDVWPEAGFDNFAWAPFQRSWAGALRSVEDVKAKANGVLDAYAIGDRPPGPAFA